MGRVNGVYECSRNIELHRASGVHYKYSREFGEWFFDTLYVCYLEARKGKRKTYDEHNFEMLAIENLRLLADACLTELYEPGGGIAFVKMEPVIREIFAAPFRDRVVHHFLHKMTMDWWARRFIYDSYSCQENKGTLLGIMRLAKMMRQVTLNYTREAYIVKMDLSGFFMSLERTKLLDAVCWGLDSQMDSESELYRMCKFLWGKVLLDDPVKKVEKRGNTALWRKVPDNKSLFKQPPGRGIVIGNLTSQDVSNIYMDAFDRFMKFQMKYRFYGRYVDDFFVLLLPEELERFFREDLSAIIGKLESMGLTLHPLKTIVRPVRYGVDFLGAHIGKGYISLGPRAEKNMGKMIRDFAHDKGGLERMTALMGTASKFDSVRQVQEMFEKVGWEYRV